MAYIVLLECDYEHCDSKTTVPQVGAMPYGWIAMRQAVATIKREVMSASSEYITKTYCSQQCLVNDNKAEANG